jgi:hypothetical protein
MFASGPMQWLMRQREEGVNPREVLSKLHIELVSGMKRKARFATHALHGIGLIVRQLCRLAQMPVSAVCISRNGLVYWF